MADSLRGLAFGFRDERSMRTHLIASALALVLLSWARPPLALAVAAGLLLLLGLALELVNSALEESLDLLHPERHPAVGRAKDKASAAAFVINVGAALVVLAALAV